MGEALTAILRNYEALLVLVSEEAAQGDPTAIGLNKQLTSYVYLALVHLAAEVLSVTNHLSKVFQYRDVCFSAVQQQLHDCIETLEDLRRSNGPVLTAMERELNATPVGHFKGAAIDFTPRRGEPDQRRRFQEIRLAFLNVLIANLRARFHHVELLSAMQVFEPASYPADRHQLVGWGNQHLQRLMDHFGRPMENRAHARFAAPIDADVCRAEFLAFKRSVLESLGERRVNGDGEEEWHFYTPPELMEHIFGGPMRGNQALYPGR